VDAASYEGKRILVVGGGDSAVEAAIGLARQRGNRVTLSYRREKLVRIKKKNEEKIAGLLAKGRVEGALGTEVEEIAPASVRLKTPAGPREIPNDYVFVFAGGEPPFGLLRRMGVRFGGAAAPTADGSVPPAPVPRPRRAARAIIDGHPRTKRSP
jgi:thioredoxin reductase (NADPH)